MDLVTITDHDSIGGCLEYLDRHPDASDFFISEEVSCRLPQGDVEVHLGVYGMDERLHRDLQPLRVTCSRSPRGCARPGVFFVLNHLLHFYRGQLPLAAYLAAARRGAGVEARNGDHDSGAQRAGRAGRERDGPAHPRLAIVGGSDAHTLRRIGRTWTESPVAKASATSRLPGEPPRVRSPRRVARRHRECRWRCLWRRRQLLREPARCRAARSLGRFGGRPAWRSRWCPFPPSSCRSSLSRRASGAKPARCGAPRHELSAWLERRQRQSSPLRRRHESTTRRHHRHRSRHGARGDARGNLAGADRGSRARSVPSRCSTPMATAAASRRRCLWHPSKRS